MLDRVPVFLTPLIFVIMKQILCHNTTVSNKLIKSLFADLALTKGTCTAVII